MFCIQAIMPHVYTICQTLSHSNNRNKKRVRFSNVIKIPHSIPSQNSIHR